MRQLHIASDHTVLQVEAVVGDEGGGDITEVLEVFNLRTVRPVLDDILKTSPVNLRASQIHGRGLLVGKSIKAGHFVGDTSVRQ